MFPNLRPGAGGLDFLSPGRLPRVTGAARGMGARWPVLPSLVFHREEAGCKQRGVSPGSQRHQRTGRPCPCHPGPGSEGEAVQSAFADKQAQRLQGSGTIPRLSTADAAVTAGPDGAPRPLPALTRVLPGWNERRSWMATRHPGRHCFDGTGHTL